MNYWKLLLRSLRFYWKSHLRVVLGTIISTSILVGALIIGDSVKFSLQQIVFYRLGNTEFALVSGDRYFRTQIADDLAEKLGTLVTPLLQTSGIAIAEGGQRRLNNIQVIGVDERFGEIGGIEDFYKNIALDEAIINSHLATRLKLKEGDEILVRIKNPGVIPRDAPLSLDSETTAARTFKIRAIAPDTRFGRFNLKADQVAPNTVYVSLFSLSKAIEQENMSNVLLIQKLLRGVQGGGFLEKSPPARRRQIIEIFRKTWGLQDAGLELRELPGRDIIEIKSNRIFLESQILKAALKVNKKARPVLTYFVNEIVCRDKSTPYSFVSAPGSPIVPAGMRDDEIIINEWLAGDISAGKGDRIRLTYYRLGEKRKLIEESANFRVREVVPLRNPYIDKDLMPDFPGLAGEQNCSDWDPGITIDLNRIRQKDEEYWDNYRGTPKAFVTLGAAQKMWRNRFGELTAIRFRGLEKGEVEKELIEEIDPASLGFVFREVKREGLRASEESVDFGQLFLGLSFFIILAALLLTGMLYVFNIEKRSEENGLLLALGFPGKEVRRFVLIEGAVTIVTGSLLGSIVGVLYNRVILYALKTVWQGAVGTSMLQVHLKFSTILTGTVIGIFIAFLAIWIVFRKQFKQPVAGLQRGLGGLEVYRYKRPRISMLIGILGVVAVIFILITTKFETGREAFMFFFFAGSLLLISGIAFIKVLLAGLRTRINTGKLGLFMIGLRSNVRRPVRSLTLIGLLACGVFIVFTVGANRVISTIDVDKRESGTGGFALYGESVVPVLYDLNSSKGARFYGLESVNVKGVSYVQCRVKEGDDASCLNLNRVSNPRLLGINPGELAKKASFTFVEKAGEVDPASPWEVFNRDLSDGSIPAVADQTVILWGLGKSIGDTLTYLDEKGREFKIKLVGGLANSVFQGSIIISEAALIRKYPSLSGYRLFLIDAPFENLEEISEELSWAMQDQGLDLELTSTRLAEFNRVENTYLSIFLILGSFGLILGSIGIGIVVWRNLREREGELALFRAVGFPGKSIRKMVLSEHIFLLAAGILCGTAAALTATLPSIITPGAGIPYVTIIMFLIIITINGIVWTYAASKAAVRGDVAAALRNE